MAKMIMPLLILAIALGEIAYGDVEFISRGDTTYECSFDDAFVTKADLSIIKGVDIDSLYDVLMTTCLVDTATEIIARVDSLGQFGVAHQILFDLDHPEHIASIAVDYIDTSFICIYYNLEFEPGKYVIFPLSPNFLDDNHPMARFKGKPGIFREIIIRDDEMTIEPRVFIY